MEKEDNKTVHVSNISEPFFSAPGLCLDPLWEVGSDLISAFQMWKLRFRMLDWLEFVQLQQRKDLWTLSTEAQWGSPYGAGFLNHLGQRTVAQSRQTAAQSRLCLAKRSTHAALWNTSSPRGIFFWKSPGLESEHRVLERQLPLLWQMRTDNEVHYFLSEHWDPFPGAALANLLHTRCCHGCVRKVTLLSVFTQH